MINSQLRSPLKKKDINSWGLVIKANCGDSLKRFGASVHQNSIDINIMNLRAKIIILFKLKLSAKVALTYVDEDSDAVALDTDDELHDAIVIQRLNPLRINVQLLHSTNQESSLGTVFSKSTTTCLQQSEKLCQFRSIFDEENSKWDKINVLQGQGELSQVVPEARKLDGLVPKPAVSAAAKPPDSSTSQSLTTSMGVTTSIDQKKERGTTKDWIFKPSDFDIGTCNVIQQHEGPCKPYIVQTINTHQTAFSPSRRDCHNDLSQSKHLLDKSFPGGSFPTRHPYKRTGIHIGVMCDGCEMYPIIGTRMKSKVKENYDLCSLCFLEIGCESDYTKIDSTDFASSSQLRKFYDSLSHSKHQLSGLHALSWKKFDSCFIQDVTISDGMLVAPSTTFTKIWRMYNNGTSGWPYGTQLVWIGGDQFSRQDCIMLDIPEEGYPAGQEIDVAIDFTSPSSAGSYVSYWRLALPSGHKFGHRVWFYIQVDKSQPDYDKEKLPTDINLNVQPESSSEHELGLTVLPKDSCTDTSDELPRDSHPATGDAVPEIMPSISSVTVPVAGLPAPLPNDLVYTVLPTEAIAGGDDEVKEKLPRDSHSATGDAVPEIMPSIYFLTIPGLSARQPNDLVYTVLPTETITVGDDAVKEVLPRDPHPATGDAVPEIMPSISFAVPGLPAPLPNDLVYTVLPTGEIIGGDEAVEEGSPIDAHRARGDAENLPADINLNLQPESSSPHKFGLSVFLENSCYDMREELPTDAHPAACLHNKPVNTELPTEAVSLGDDAVEQTLRKELEDMGFKQVDLNEVSSVSDNNLEKSLSDLHYEEWDMLLTELQELGFYDEEKNKTLLIKNSGSIARVVKDLIAEENA